jgi:hypothetical protein
MLIASLSGGLIVFAWGAIAHMALPLGTMGLKSLPNESAVLAGLSTAIAEPGLYFYPAMDLSRTLSPQEEADWENRYRTGPTGLVLFHPRGGEPMTARMFVVEFLSNVAASLVAALLLCTMTVSYARRVLIVALLGVFAWLSLSVSYWNWYGFPGLFIVAEGIDQTVGWLLAGLAIAKIVPPVTRAQN